MEKTREKKKKMNFKEKGINKGKFNKRLKGIGLGDIFRNFLCKRKKATDFFDSFLYFL